MLTVECVEKIRDNSNKIVGYVLEDNCTNQKQVTAQQLKVAIFNGQIKVSNLTLTSDGRLVDSAKGNQNTDVLEIEKEDIENRFIYTTSQFLQNNSPVRNGINSDVDCEDNKYHKTIVFYVKQGHFVSKEEDAKAIGSRLDGKLRQGNYGIGITVRMTEVKKFGQSGPSIYKAKVVIGEVYRDADDITGEYKLGALENQLYRDMSIYLTRELQTMLAGLYARQTSSNDAREASGEFLDIFAEQFAVTILSMILPKLAGNIEGKVISNKISKEFKAINKELDERHIDESKVDKDLLTAVAGNKASSDEAAQRIGMKKFSNGILKAFLR